MRQDNVKLNDLVENIFRLSPGQKKGLAKLKIRSALDLLRHFPSRYEVPGEMKNIADIASGETVFLKGKMSGLKTRRTYRKKINLSEAKLSDSTGTINIVWFNQPYLAKVLKEGDFLVLNGRVSEGKKGLYLANPSFEFKNSVSEYSEIPDTPAPIYGETKGVTSRWLNLSVLKILQKVDESEFNDFIPENILKKYHLPDLKQAMRNIHNPRALKNAEAAKKRFAFEEIFLIQLARIRERIFRNLKPRFALSVDYEDLKNFTAGIPFKLTDAQRKAIFRVAEDFKKNEAMGRLLEGDVGSGKTIVALACAHIVIQNGFQTAYMAPTEILARQHFDTFIKYFKNIPAIKIGLITSSECKKFPSKVSKSKSTHISKSQILKWAENGEIQILVGTHSLIQKNVVFKNLALAVIDEQHRFGVRQRLKITQKNSGRVPHLLSMTATPIPRTLALTIYGDLDLTILDEMPAGRKQVMTYVVPPAQRSRAYEHIREEIKKGRQAFVVCPRIEAGSEELEAGNVQNPISNFQSPTPIMKAVKEEYDKLSKEIFPEYELAILHGKLLPKEKEKTMTDFKEGKIDILVTTSVIEVGIDVPNANCILIEGADRFGLAQLHQMRGRVLRSEEQAFCFILSESSSEKTLKRLAALKQAKNGFELAEYDLKFRGAGELFGSRQWGISDLGMEALKNIKMVEAARLEAADLLKQDLGLKKYPFLKQAMKNYENNLHWE